jgi:uncharacterized membrane protein
MPIIKKRTLKVPEVVSTYSIKNQRIDGLSDGIFAIVMTLLAFDLRIPEVHGSLSDLHLLQILGNLTPVFLSYALTFALLFTYWRSHHFLVSVYAKNLTVGLANYNALFFLFIAVVPFSARLLGEYSYNHIAIIVYGLNVICIGLSLLAMRRHIEVSPKIEVANILSPDLRSAYIRVMVPIISAVLAIVLSNLNTSFSMALFAFGILFNIVPASSNIIHHFVDRLSSNDTIVE